MSQIWCSRGKPIEKTAGSAHRNKTPRRIAEPPMTLRLVSSGDDRALAIRDHVLPLLRRDGALEVQRDTVRLIELCMDPWIFRSWTPFSALLPGEASSPGYRHAIERQRSRPDLP